MPPNPSNADLKEDLAVIAPDGGWGWLVVLASFICCFVIDGSIYSFGIFLKEIGDHFHAHPTMVGWAHSLYTGFSALFGPLVCGLVNHYGFRAVGFVGGILAASAFLISTYVMSIATFIVVLGVIGGTGLGMLSLPAIVAVGYYFERLRNVAFSIAYTGSALGIILFPLIMDKLMSGASWKMKFLFIMSTCLLCSLVSLLFKPIKPVRVLLTQDEELVEILPENEELMSVISETSTSETESDESPPTPVEKPMERDDIFLKASVFGMPVAKSKSTTSDKRQANIGLSVASMIHPTISIVRPSVRSLAPATSVHQRVKYHFKDLCATVVTMTIKMLHCGLLKSPAFCLVLLNIFVYTLGMYAPYLFIQERATQSGIHKSQSNYLYTGVGIANVVGRIASGFLTNIPGVTPLNASYTIIILGGLASILSILCHNLATQLVYFAIFGLISASIATLKVSVMVDLLGIENLTNAYGLSLFFFGIASFLGAPIAGEIVRINNSYNSAYIFSGCMYITSAILLIPVKAVYRWEMKHV